MSGHKVQSSYPLKAVTGTTTVLFAHLAEALWLVNTLLQAITTSFVLNAPGKFRKNDVIRVCIETFANQRASAR